MASYAYGRRTEIYHEYELGNPVAYGELAKAYAAACADYLATFGKQPSSDDAIMLRADEESITLYFTQGKNFFGGTSSDAGGES